MQLALASCRDLPEWEVDDGPLHDALAARGVAVARPAWDDPRVRWADFDGVLIRTTWDYVPRHAAFVAWAARVAAVTRLWNDADTVRWNIDKRYLLELEAAGVPTVPTLWLAPGHGLDPASLSERGWSRGFIKPAIGASAVGTLRFDADVEGLAAVAAHLATEPPGWQLLQPYLARVEREGERSAVVIDGALSHCVRKIPVAGDYRVQDDYGASDERYAPDAAERALIRRARGFMEARTPPPLVYRIDWLLDDAGAPRLNELEAVEPSLFFRHDPAAATRLADALVARLRG